MRNYFVLCLLIIGLISPHSSVEHWQNVSKHFSKNIIGHKIVDRQEYFDEQIDEAIKRVVIDEKLADYINVLLEESYKEMQLDTKEKHDYLVEEIKKAETLKDKLLDMYIDGDLDKQLWTQKTQECEYSIKMYNSKLETMKQVDRKFINEGTNIINLSKQTYNLYKQQTIEEKRRLLDVIFERMTVKDRVINYIYKPPFSYFAKCDLDDVNGIAEYLKSKIGK